MLNKSLWCGKMKFKVAEKCRFSKRKVQFLRAKEQDFFREEPKICLDDRHALNLAGMGQGSEF